MDLYAEYAQRLTELDEIRVRYQEALRKSRPIGPDSLGPRPPLAQDLVADLLSKGFICDADFSGASFQVSIPSDLARNPGISKSPNTKIATNKVKTASRLITIERRLILWQLLDEEQQREIQKLRNGVVYGSQDYGFHTPYGFFVPETKFVAWLGWVKQTDEKIQSFMKESIKNILKQETTINQQFKREFLKHFPKAPEVNVNKAATIVKQHLVDLRKVRKHERIFRPTWYPANAYPSGSWLNIIQDAALSKYAGTTADEVFLRNLADFAHAACKQARSSTQGLRPRSSKKTCEEALDRVRTWNFYEDKELESWCQELKHVIKLLSGTPARLTKEQLKMRREDVARRVEKLNEDALKMVSETDEWRVLPADDVLKRFVSVLTQAP